MYRFYKGGPFRVGDRVRRTGTDFQGVKKGGVYTVKAVARDGAWLSVEDDAVAPYSYPYLYTEFENAA